MKSLSTGQQNLWISAILILLATLIWLGFFWQPPANHVAKTEHTQLALSGLPTGGDFTLDSPNGQISLSQYRGKVVLLYFGYTFCPDICPTSLAAMAQAFSLLKPGELSKVQGLFISVDPARDTMDVLKVYAPFFHPAIFGASGTPQQIAEVASRYGVRYMFQRPNANGIYSVDHSAFVYLVAPDGKLVATLAHGSPPEEIVAIIRRHLAR